MIIIKVDHAKTNTNPLVLAIIVQLHQGHVCVYTYIYVSTYMLGETLGNHDKRSKKGYFKKKYMGTVGLVLYL